MTYIFTFSLNPTTNEAAYAGNIELQQALQILQGLVIADAVNKATQLKAEKEAVKDKDVESPSESI